MVWFWRSKCFILCTIFLSLSRFITHHLWAFRSLIRLFIHSLSIKKWPHTIIIGYSKSLSERLANIMGFNFAGANRMNRGMCTAAYACTVLCMYILLAWRGPHIFHLFLFVVLFLLRKSNATTSHCWCLGFFAPLIFVIYTLNLWYSSGIAVPILVKADLATILVCSWLN